MKLNIIYYTHVEGGEVLPHFPPGTAKADLRVRFWDPGKYCHALKCAIFTGLHQLYRCTNIWFHLKPHLPPPATNQSSIRIFKREQWTRYFYSRNRLLVLEQILCLPTEPAGENTNLQADCLAGGWTAPYMQLKPKRRCMNTLGSGMLSCVWVFSTYQLPWSQRLLCHTFSISPPLWYSFS